jgi:hypothetical protein
MINIGTLMGAGIKFYSTLSANNLADLKKMLITNNNRTISLIKINQWDDSWQGIKSDFAINELTQEHIIWINSSINHHLE